MDSMEDEDGGGRSRSSCDSPGEIVRRLSSTMTRRPRPGNTRAKEIKEIETTANDPRSTFETASAEGASSTTLAIHDLIAGGVAGSAGIFVGHPFDSMKVRVQMAANVASGSGSAVLQAPHFNGSVWAGLGSPLAMAALINASIFLTFGACKRSWTEHGLDRRYSSRTRDAACGCTAGFASSLLISPAELVKTKLQTQRPSSSPIYRNSLQSARLILAKHGIAGLYQGFVATAIRQTPGIGVYLTTYDQLRNTIHSNYFDHSSSGEATKDRNLLLASIAAGGIAGSFSWAIVYPIDVIKSRIQALPYDTRRHEQSILNISRQVVLHGVGGLFRGFSIAVFRAFPVNAIIFPTYEVTQKIIKQR